MNHFEYYTLKGRPIKFKHIEYDKRRPGDIINHFEQHYGSAEQHLAMFRDGLYVPENYKIALRCYFTSCLNHLEEAE